MLLRSFAYFLLLLGGAVAQVPRGDEYLDSREKKNALARVEKAIADERRPVDRPHLWIATPRALVLYSSDSDRPEDLDASAAAARELAQDRIEAGFDACEKILPPHEKCGERFAILDEHWLLWRLWNRQTDDEEDPHAPSPPSGPVVRSHPAQSSQIDTFALAQRHRVVAANSSAVMIWAIYEKAWFGEVVPAPWFTELAIERLRVEMKSREDFKGRKGPPPPFSKQDARGWARLGKSEIEAVVARIKPGKVEARQHGSSTLPGASGLLAMFLGHGQADLEDKFDPTWSSILSVYASSLLDGEDDEVAVKLATEKLDRKALVASMTKWVKLRTR